MERYFSCSDEELIAFKSNLKAEVTETANGARFLKYDENSFFDLNLEDGMKYVYDMNGRILFTGGYDSEYYPNGLPERIMLFCDFLNLSVCKRFKNHKVFIMDGENGPVDISDWFDENADHSHITLLKYTGVGYFGDLGIGEQVKSVTIPSGITEICEGACKDFSELEHVELPEGLIRIGKDAFSHCKKLKEIVFPSSLKEIDACAFYNCFSLKEVYIPENVRKLGTSAFFECKVLKKVTIDGKITEIPMYCFRQCYNLREIKLPDSLIRIGEMAFHYSGVKELVVPYGVIEICNGAFSDCRSLVVSLPKSIQTIKDYAFCNCRGWYYRDSD